MKKWDVYVTGDINVDLLVQGLDKLPLPGQEVNVNNIELCVGGGAALFTLGLAKLGVNTVFDGVLGNDMYGKFILEELKNKSIDTTLLKISSKNRTGVSIALTNEKDRAFITYIGSNAEVELNIDDNVNLAKHIHLTSYRGRSNHETYINALKKIKASDISVSFDVGWDDTGDWYEGIYEIISYVDIFFINEMEAINYSRCQTVEEAIKKFSKYCNNIVVKMGSKGSISYKNGEIETANAYKVKAVDTTGAGDSFNAGYVYGFLRGEELKKCLEYGNACGALSVTEFGGNAGFPYEESLHEFIYKQEALL